MRIIVPMAGMGKRMRPHTLTTPKPLLPIAGKPIVHRLVEDIAKSANEKIEEVAFIIGRFGNEAEEKLKQIAANVGAKTSIYYQDEALGTAHAIMCAKDSLDGKLVVAFADTLFRADFTLDDQNDGAIWVKKVNDPRQFGVVKVNDENVITDFAEKPEEFVSDLAIIGIYYFRDGANLKKEIQYLLDNNIKDKGEFQLTSALENMKNKGLRFTPAPVTEWLDCGNKDATVHTNQRILEFIRNEQLQHESVQLIHSQVIEPCYLGPNVKVVNSVIGPYVSVGAGSVVQNAVISNSIIRDAAKITNTVLTNSLIGNNVEFTGTSLELSMGDFSTQTVTAHKKEATIPATNGTSKKQKKTSGADLAV